MSLRAGVALLAVVGLAGLTAPWTARDPVDPEDPAGARLLPPFTVAYVLRTAPQQTLIVNDLDAAPGGWRFTRAGIHGSVSDSALIEPPARCFFLLGTDALGRDLASRLLFAIRRTLWIASVTVVLSLGLGVAIGGAAGLAGGLGDAALMRLTDALMAIPRLLLYLACVALMRPSTPLLVLLLAATTWPPLARIVRAQVLAVRDGDGLLAARALGSTLPRLILRHVLPAVGPAVAVASTLRFADTVLLESALAFLGLSAPPPAVSLGTLVAAGRDSLADAWWIAFIPGVVIVALVAALRAIVGGILRVPDAPSAT